MVANVDEEAVTVNTRALIDKVLARYSGDWTTLRELIQNAADASAKKVIIRFESMPSKTVPLPSTSDPAALLRHTVQHHTIERLIVSNNGQSFNQNDWNRLKRIAEGNPDETKIGAFGVGFYSVFADCEEPFVISGDKSMAFYWKGNSLFTKAGALPAGRSNSETTFVLNYRNTSSPVPDLMSVCQFLSTSLTFVGLESMEFWLDQWKILDLQKKQAPGVDVRLPADVKKVTKEKMMKVTRLTQQSTQIDAQWLNVVAFNSKAATASQTADDADDRGPSLRGFFYRLTENKHTTAAKKAAREAEIVAQREIDANLAVTSRATAFLRISTVDIQTSVTKLFAEELERATKKPPPKHTRIAILTSSHEEATASSSTSSGITASKAQDLFASVVPTKNGRIFIGFPTSQTTGLLCHISAPSVIPTVERESIDLNARYVRTWNIEMLRVAGIACRIAYGGEMQQLKQKIDASYKTAGRLSASKADVDPVVPEAVHIFKQYTAVESTPSANVGKHIEEAFWECNEKGTIDVISTKGVMPSSKVRLVAEPLSFLGEVPLIPAEVAYGAEGFVRALHERNLVSDMTIKDILKELEARPLTEEQFIEFLKWASNQYKLKVLDASTIQGLFESMVVTLDAPKPEDAATTSGSPTPILVVGEITSYISGSKIPVDPEIPLPPTTLPFRFSRVIPIDHLKAFNFEELQLVPWVRFLLEGETSRSLPKEQCLTQTPEFAAKVLTIISKQWDHISQGSRQTIVENLSSRPCFPTKLGMRVPTEAYFPTVKLFEDLPRVVGLNQVRDKVLQAFGVRKTIELNYVFDRLLQSPQKTKDGQTTERSWSFVDLIQYLVSVQNDIPKRDIDRLRSTAICPIEDGTGPQNGKLYKVSELYEPKDILRKLGLPILQWTGYFRLGSPEAKFLTFLGLRNAPSMPELINIMIKAAAKNDLHMYDMAFNYLRENYANNGYAATPLEPIRNMPFLLVEGKEFPTLVPPSQCFANDSAKVMGFTVLRASLQPFAIMFGVQQHPPIGECARRLINNPPTTRQDAVKVFGYFAGRLAEVHGNVAAQLSDSLIVPITSKDEKARTRLSSPKSVFLGESTAYGDIFDFVDFGLDANSFLLKIGSKHEPTSIELARMVADNPSKILGVLEDKRYLSLLRKLAENQAALKNDKALWKQLKVQACLLAYQEVPATAKEPKNSEKSGFGYDFDEDDEPTVKLYSLRKSADIVVADTVTELMLFRQHLSQAPQDETLEAFYQELGVPLLSSLLDQSQRIGPVQRDQTEAQKIRKLIIERSRLFLSEYSSGVRHDTKWLEKHLSVDVVDSLSLAYSLRGYNIAPVRIKKTATMSQQGANYALHIVRNPDLYEVSTWVCRLLLTRPRQHDTLALETVLASDLRRLRVKGYNIDRILKQKEYDTRLAEEQKRRQQEQQEQEQRAVEESRMKQLAEAPPPYEPDTPQQHQLDRPKTPKDVTPQHKMPGGFGDHSPEQDEPHQLPVRQQPPKQNGLFDSAQQWAKSWGDQIRGNSSQNSLPAPPAQGGRGPSTVEPKSSERNVTQNLANAIKSCRSHTSSDVFSAPRTVDVEEAKGAYCDSSPAQDISFLFDSPSGIKMFIANHISDRGTFAAQNGHQINNFASVLLDIAAIFNISQKTLHIFYDPKGATIAFNLNGALFFNFHWYKQLHAALSETSRDMRIQTVAYWWVVFCHELAHNLVSEHSAQHSFYAESFAQQYFGKVMARVMQY